MFITATLRSHPISSAIRKLLPSEPSFLPPITANSPGTLYEILSRKPNGGVGQFVHQQRWSNKRIKDCYWEVTRTRFKLNGTHGRAWGRLTWRGVPVSEKEEQIPGSLKFTWAYGKSTGIHWPSTPNAGLEMQAETVAAAA